MARPSIEANLKAAQYNLNITNTILNRRPMSADPKIVAAYEQQQVERARPSAERGATFAIKFAVQILLDIAGER